MYGVGREHATLDARAAGAEGSHGESVQRPQGGRGTDEVVRGPPREHSASRDVASRTPQEASGLPGPNTASLVGTHAPPARAPSPDPLRNPTPERKSVVRSLSSLWGNRSLAHPGALSDVTNREQHSGSKEGSSAQRPKQQQRQGQGQGKGQGQTEVQSDRQRWGPLFGRKAQRPAEQGGTQRTPDTTACSLQGAPRSEAEEGPQAGYGGGKPGLKGGAPARRTRGAKGSATGGSGVGGAVDGQEERGTGSEETEEQSEAPLSGAAAGRGSRKPRVQGVDERPALRCHSSDVKIEGTALPSEGRADPSSGSPDESNSVKAAAGEGREGKAAAAGSGQRGTKRGPRNSKGASKDSAADSAPASTPDSAPSPSLAPAKDTLQRSMLSFFRRSKGGDSTQAKPMEAGGAATASRGAGAEGRKDTSGDTGTACTSMPPPDTGATVEEGTRGFKHNDTGNVLAGEIRLGVDVEMPDALLSGEDARPQLSEVTHTPVASSLSLGAACRGQGEEMWASEATCSHSRGQPVSEARGTSDPSAGVPSLQAPLLHEQARVSEGMPQAEDERSQGQDQDQGGGKAERGGPSGYTVGVLTSGQLRHGYTLTAVVHHLGDSAHYGHYVADVWDPAAKQWAHHDDSLVQEVSLQGLQFQASRGPLLAVEAPCRKLHSASAVCLHRACCN